MDRDWARLGRALAQAREAINLTQVEIAERVGVTRTPIQAIEHGKPFKKVTGTIRDYARIVGWLDGSVEAVLDGGEPTLAAPAAELAPAEPAPSPSVSRLPLRVRRALEESGEVLDAQVIDLGPGQGSTRLIVVAKGKPGASPEELARALEEWSDRDLHQRGIVPPGEDNGGPEAAAE